MTKAPLENDAPKLSVIVPAHNEEQNILPLVGRLEEALDAVPGGFEIIVVNDGSIDRTKDVLKCLELAGRIRVVTHGFNRGYGAALRSGFAAARGAFVSFIDGDGQLDPVDLYKLFRSAKRHIFVIGYRVKRRDNFLRLCLGRVFSSIFVPLFIGVRVRDVDCALKVFPRSFLHEAELEADGALINAELLAHAAAMGYEFLEAPVNHKPRSSGEQSGASLPVIARVMSELFAVRRRVNAGRRQAMAARLGASAT